MFAHPATTHFARSYTSQHTGTGGPNTTRRKLTVHDENGPGGLGFGRDAPGKYLPSKTPSRAGPSKGAGAGAGAGAGTGARLGLGLGARTEGRDRNVLQAGAGGRGGDAPGEGKGKGKAGDDIGPKRLFASSSTIAPSKSLSNLQPTQLASRPLKTPARAPPSSRKHFGAGAGASALRTPAPSFRVPLDLSPTFEAPAPTPLPSAQRRRRSRSSGASIASLAAVASGSRGGGGGATRVQQQQAAGRVYETPLPSAHAKWDEEPSLESIDEVGDGEVGFAGGIGADGAEGGWGEVEYMPPKFHAPPDIPDEYTYHDRVDLTDLLSEAEKESREAYARLGPALVLGTAGEADGPFMIRTEEEMMDPRFRPDPPIQSARPTQPQTQQGAKGAIGAKAGGKGSVRFAPAPAPARAGVVAPKPGTTSGISSGRVPSGAAPSTSTIRARAPGTSTTAGPSVARSLPTAGIAGTKTAVRSITGPPTVSSASRLGPSRTAGGGAGASGRGAASQGNPAPRAVPVTTRGVARSGAPPAIVRDMKAAAAAEEEDLLILADEGSAADDGMMLDVDWVDTLAEEEPREGEVRAAVETRADVVDRDESEGLMAAVG